MIPQERQQGAVMSEMVLALAIAAMSAVGGIIYWNTLGPPTRLKAESHEIGLLADAEHVRRYRPAAPVDFDCVDPAAVADPTNALHGLSTFGDCVISTAFDCTAPANQVAGRCGSQTTGTVTLTSPGVRTHKSRTVNCPDTSAQVDVTITDTDGRDTGWVLRYEPGHQSGRLVHVSTGRDFAWQPMPIGRADSPEHLADLLMPHARAGELSTVSRSGAGAVAGTDQLTCESVR